MPKILVCSSNQPQQSSNTTTQSLPQGRHAKLDHNKRVEDWKPADVATYIKQIGYPEYAENFLKNDIDGKSLMSLDRQEFDDLGINSVGHRKTIERSINSLKEASRMNTSSVGSIPDSIQQNDSMPHRSAHNSHSALSPSGNPYTNHSHSSNSRWVPTQDPKQKMRDQSMYSHLWDSIAGRKDYCNTQEYKHLMLRASLPQDTIKEVWRLVTGDQMNQERCSFDQFSAMMKLTSLAQMNVPLFLIQLDKLQWYHPNAPQFTALPPYSDMQMMQATQNMVSFRNIPIQVLDSDERLMELEKLALRKFSPIHFEINGNILVATFRKKIDQNCLDQLRWHTRQALQRMGFSTQALSQLNLTIPAPTDLGATPGGPETNDQFNTPGGGYGHNSYSGSGGAYQNDPYHSRYVNQPPMNSSYASPQTKPFQPPPPSGPPPTNGNYNQNGRPHGHTQNQSTALPTFIPKSELERLMRPETFWSEFCNRVDIDLMVPNPKDKIRTRVAMNMIAKLRGVPPKDVNFSDKGVSILASKSLEELKTKYLHLPSNQTIADLLDIDMAEIHDMYKGIEIEGLPTEITGDDDVIRQLDTHVLDSFRVNHIEVVGIDAQKLRITFANSISQADIDKLRKFLKSFLNDELKVEKKILRKVTIFPYTHSSWKDIVDFKDSEYGHTPYET